MAGTIPATLIRLYLISSSLFVVCRWNSLALQSALFIYVEKEDAARRRPSVDSSRPHQQPLIIKDFLYLTETHNWQKITRLKRNDKSMEEIPEQAVLITDITFSANAANGLMV